MFRGKKLPNGNFVVPMRAEERGTVAAGMVEIGPDHPQYASWAEWFAKNPAKLDDASKQDSKDHAAA